MVKFGGHIEALREGDLADANLYLVPYNEMKSLIVEIVAIPSPSPALKAGGFPSGAAITASTSSSTPSEEEKQREFDADTFVRDWKKALKDAERDLEKAREEMWRMVFTAIDESTPDHDDDDADNQIGLVRGATPGNAIQLYVNLFRKHRPQCVSCPGDSKEDDRPSSPNCGGNPDELLVRMKQVHTAASINSEGLRKLVKKADKHSRGMRLSSSLLPLLYTSSLYTGQNMMQDGIYLLREILTTGERQTPSYYDHYDGTGPAYVEDDDDDEEDQQRWGSRPKMYRNNSEVRHQKSVDLRQREIEWLRNLVKNFPERDLLMPKLVSHRGFHQMSDHTDKRPVENSLAAYEIAWTSGIELCECDIALTKDEKLVLAHDENFLRLGLDKKSEKSKRKVSDLTFKELISMPLTSGSRPPLLIDVLRSASAISEKSKLIIEIKPGNDVSALALARLLIRHPDLRSSVAMVMSFDAATMHRLRVELDRAAVASGLIDSTSGGAMLGHHHHRRNNTTASFGNAVGGLGSSSNINPYAAATFHKNNHHRRVSSYDHFGAMSSGWLAGMASPSLTPLAGSGGGISPAVGAGLPPVPGLGGMSSPRDSTSQLGLSISHLNLHDDSPSPGMKPMEEGEKLEASALMMPSLVLPEGAASAALTDSTTSLPPKSPRHSISSAGYSFPKLMLLTVSDPPSRACELQVKHNELHRVDHWLTQEDGALDGVYLQYEKEMMTPEGAACLKELSERHLVGVWAFAHKDPDDFETFSWLCKEGNVSFVNTDLPKNFRKEGAGSMN